MEFLVVVAVIAVIACILVIDTFVGRPLKYPPPMPASKPVAVTTPESEFKAVAASPQSSLIPSAELQKKTPPEEFSVNNATANSFERNLIARQTIQVAGVSYQNMSGLSRQDCIDRLSVIDKLWLKRDKNNLHDENAICVMSKYGQIGFIPRDYSVKIIDMDVDAIGASLISKGVASNGLWGCTIEILISGGVQDLPPTRKGKGFSEVQVKDGRAYPHILLLQQLDSLAAEIFDPEDDIKLTHTSLGDGKIIKIQPRDNAKALLTVMYETETCKHASDIFSSPHISNTPAPVSMKASAVSKYINLLPSAKPYESKKSRFLDWTDSDSDVDPLAQLSKIERAYLIDGWHADDYYSDPDNGNDGVDSYWHEYHRHD